jgi:hypothetical protein
LTILAVPFPTAPPTPCSSSQDSTREMSSVPYAIAAAAELGCASQIVLRVEFPSLSTPYGWNVCESFAVHTLYGWNVCEGLPWKAPYGWNLAKAYRERERWRHIPLQIVNSSGRRFDCNA